MPVRPAIRFVSADAGGGAGAGAAAGALAVATRVAASPGVDGAASRVEQAVNARMPVAMGTTSAWSERTAAADDSSMKTTEGGK